MTSTRFIDFDRRPTRDMELPIWAYYRSVDDAPEQWVLVALNEFREVGSAGRWYARIDFGNEETWAAPEDLRLPKFACAECGEPAQEQRPTALGGRGRFSHLDGEPLCPVMGEDGYEPCGVV